MSPERGFKKRETKPFKLGPAVAGWGEVTTLDRVDSVALNGGRPSGVPANERSALEV